MKGDRGGWKNWQKLIVMKGIWAFSLGEWTAIKYM